MNKDSRHLPGAPTDFGRTLGHCGKSLSLVLDEQVGLVSFREMPHLSDKEVHIQSCRAQVVLEPCDDLYTYLFIYLYLYYIGNVLIRIKEKEASCAWLCAVKLGQWQPEEKGYGEWRAEEKGKEPEGTFEVLIMTVVT